MNEEKENVFEEGDQQSLTPCSSSTLLQSSALAKFNKIIDSTVTATNYYSTNASDQPTTETTLELTLPTTKVVVDHQTQQQPSPNNLNTSKKNYSIRSGTSSSSTGSCSSKLLSKFNVFSSNSRNTTATTTAVAATAYNCNNLNDNQTKRNDVHYLLKHLNSFSDIEEIEIVDMKKHSSNRTHKTTKTTATTTITTTPAATAIPTNNSVNNLASGTLNSRILRHLPIPLLPQHYYDDYIFQSCHYLDTSCFATTITTAISGMGSGNQNESGVCPGPSQVSYSTNASSQSQSYENFLDHTGQVMATRLRRNGQSCSGSTTPTAPSQSQQEFESSAIYNTTSRLVTGDIVKTELSSPSCNGVDHRRKSFFKCCYAPIDRWREKRQQHHQNQQQAAILSEPGSSSGGKFGDLV